MGKWEINSLNLINNVKGPDKNLEMKIIELTSRGWWWRYLLVLKFTQPKSKTNYSLHLKIFESFDYFNHNKKNV